MKPSSQHFVTFAVFLYMAVMAAREQSILMALGGLLLLSFSMLRDRVWVSQSLAATLAVTTLGLVGAACALTAVAQIGQPLRSLQH